MGCGPETTDDEFSCSSLNIFEKVIVSSRTVIINNITIIKDGQNHKYYKGQEVNTWEKSS